MALQQCEGCKLWFDPGDIRTTDDDVELCPECYDDCPKVVDDDGWDDAEGWE